MQSGKPRRPWLRMALLGPLVLLALALQVVVHVYVSAISPAQLIVPLLGAFTTYWALTKLPISSLVYMPRLTADSQHTPNLYGNENKFLALQSARHLLAGGLVAYFIEFNVIPYVLNETSILTGFVENLSAGLFVVIILAAVFLFFAADRLTDTTPVWRFVARRLWLSHHQYAESLSKPELAGYRRQLRAIRVIHFAIGLGAFRFFPVAYVVILLGAVAWNLLHQGRHGPSHECESPGKRTNASGARSSSSDLRLGFLASSLLGTSILYVLSDFGETSAAVAIGLFTIHTVAAGLYYLWGRHTRYPPIWIAIGGVLLAIAGTVLFFAVPHSYPLGFLEEAEFVSIGEVPDAVTYVVPFEAFGHHVIRWILAVFATWFYVVPILRLAAHYMEEQSNPRLWVGYSLLKDTADLAAKCAFALAVFAVPALAAVISISNTLPGFLGMDGANLIASALPSTDPGALGSSMASFDFSSSAPRIIAVAALVWYASVALIGPVVLAVRKLRRIQGDLGRRFQIPGARVRVLALLFRFGKGFEAESGSASTSDGEHEPRNARRRSLTRLGGADRWITPLGRATFIMVPVACLVAGVILMLPYLQPVLDWPSHKQQAQAEIAAAIEEQDTGPLIDMAENAKEGSIRALAVAGLLCCERSGSSTEAGRLAAADSEALVRANAYGVMGYWLDEENLDILTEAAAVETDARARSEALIAQRLIEQGSEIAHLYDSGRLAEGEYEQRLSELRLLQLRRWYCSSGVPEGELLRGHEESVWALFCRQAWPPGLR